MIGDCYLIVLQSSLQLQTKKDHCAKQMECENLWHLNVVGGHDNQIYQLIGVKVSQYPFILHGTYNTNSWFFLCR